LRGLFILTISSQVTRKTKFPQAAATPNHALQRTAPALTLAAPPPSPAQPSRQPPPSLSLGSLGVASRLLMSAQKTKPQKQNNHATRTKKTIHRFHQGKSRQAPRPAKGSERKEKTERGMARQPLAKEKVTNKAHFRRKNGTNQTTICRSNILTLTSEKARG